MERIVIHTGLDDFLLLDRIEETGPDRITGFRRFSEAPAYLAVEACAQLCALHVRYLTGFDCHAFLLGIPQCRLPDAEILSGEYRINATLQSRSDRAFSYNVTAEHGSSPVSGKFMIATVPYDRKFRKEILQPHYRKVFACLQNASPGN